MSKWFGLNRFYKIEPFLSFEFESFFWHTFLFVRPLRQEARLRRQGDWSDRKSPGFALSHWQGHLFSTSMSSLSVPPPQCLLQPFTVPHRYLFGPGPSNVPQRISTAGAQPMLGHLHTETIEVKYHNKRSFMCFAKEFMIIHGLKYTYMPIYCNHMLSKCQECAVKKWQIQ